MALKWIQVVKKQSGCKLPRDSGSFFCKKRNSTTFLTIIFIFSLQFQKKHLQLKRSSPLTLFSVQS